MKKEDYIAKYGEEAWQRYLEKKRIYDQDNYEKTQIRKEKYRNKNKSLLAEKSKIYRQDNKEKVKAYKEGYYKTKMGRASFINLRYNQEDKKRGFNISNNVSSKWIVDNIFSGQKCVYCGDQDWTHLGCDRKDNNKPHTADNVVCACGLCNIERGNNYTVEEFKQYRPLHPRACDIPKAPAIQLSETGALKKRAVQIG